jgi:hypothetical protein
MLEIKRICETRPFPKETCLRKAREFDMYDRFGEYISLYKIDGSVYPEECE